MVRPAVAHEHSFEGRYELIAKLGEGGFGTVHKARQRTTGQLVAVKVMRLAEPWKGAPVWSRRARQRMPQTFQPAIQSMSFAPEGFIACFVDTTSIGSIVTKS